MPEYNKDIRRNLRLSVLSALIVISLMSPLDLKSFGLFFFLHSRFTPCLHSFGIRETTPGNNVKTFMCLRVTPGNVPIPTTWFHYVECRVFKQGRS